MSELLTKYRTLPPETQQQMVVDTSIFIEHLRAANKAGTTLQKLPDQSQLYVSSSENHRQVNYRYKLPQTLPTVRTAVGGSRFDKMTTRKACRHLFGNIIC